MIALIGKMTEKLDAAIASSVDPSSVESLTERVAVLESSVTVLIDTVSKLIDLSPLRPIAPVKIH